MTSPKIHCSHSEVWTLDKFKPHPRNPNTHPPEQIKLLGKIISSQGWRSPVCVSKRSGFVIKGHGRLAAAAESGLTEAPVDLQDYASEADEWADLIADNRIAELAEIDLSGLKDMLGEMGSSEGFDMDLTGFDKMELTRLSLDIHEVGANKVSEVYVGLPACENENQLGICVLVRFITMEEKLKFASLIGQLITEKTKSVWHPKRVQDQFGTKEGITYGTE